VTLFNASEYRAAVLSAVERVRFHKPLTFAELAKRTAIQPTYLSNVLKGRAHFSSDQLYSIGKFLELSEPELEFVLLLLEWERCSVKERKRELGKRLEAIRQEHLSTASHVTAKKVIPQDLASSEYYLDPLVKVVHVFLTIDRYGKDPKLIAEALRISPEYLGRILETLVRLGYTEAKPAGGYAIRVKHRHLPDESPLCLPHQALMRSRSLEQFQRLSRGKRYGFSATFSATPDTRAKIQAEFLEFVKKAEALVGASKETHVFQMNFDLFPWAD
jgi:uncharacterized protein (TIGR02147 family)